MEKEEVKTKRKTNLETELAVQRTQMSCQRSLLSYIRTACVFVSLAFTYLKIASYDKFDAFVICMFIIGVLFLAFGLFEYFSIKNRTKKLYEEFNSVEIEEPSEEE